MDASHPMPHTSPVPIVVALVAGIFLFLGAMFVAYSRAAADFYGIASHDRAALFYVRAIGFRDLALAAYLLGLSALGGRRALAIVLAATIVIPMGDIALLILSGTARAIHFILHGASLLCFAGLALWAHADARRG